ncbi:MAG: threonylcarbamoyl-AMP synthase [Myxococcales bacterium]|jgi:tRNA threonylcarbamoyl adenosine modification protein (Sua5/YciO/YrdC/YwlC family)|nr:threonylcarbamoyl-AMP synthase [Myxococcales bacterium]
MTAQIFQIHPVDPQPRLLDKAAQALQRGGLIAYPTDSYYGLGCDLLDRRAIDRLYQLKGRDRRKPMSFLVADLSEVSRYAKVSNFAYRILRHLTPGPFTFVLEATRLVPEIMQTRQQTVGLRVPENVVAHALCERLGHPIVSTSARNRDGEVLRDPEELRDEFSHGLDIILDAGISENDPSTVLSLVGDTVTLLRQGKGDASSVL